MVAPMRPREPIAAVIALATLSGCASSGPPAPRPPEPKVIADRRLCVGTPDDPKAERDPACASDETHEAVELVHHRAGCRAGLRGPATFRVGEQLLATLRPGERKSLRLPRGDVELIVDADGRRETRALSLAGAGPVVVELGCGPERFLARGLQPLLIEGPRGGCADAPVPVRAGGLVLAVGPDQVQTLFLPRGSHVVKVGGIERTVELGEGGAIVPLGCGTAGPP
jgi:hypothetical protein